MRWSILVLASVGCDAQFHLIEVGPRIDGDVEAAIDAPATNKYFGEGDADGDGLANADDPCPFGPVNDDGDGDGVGDNCDPHPGVPGDCIVFFEDFRDIAVLDSRWIAYADAGSFNLSTACSFDSKAAYCSPLPASHGYVFFQDLFALAEVRVKVNIIAQGTADKEIAFTVSDALSTTATEVTGRACGTGRDPADSHPIVIIDDLVDGAPVVKQHATATIAPVNGEDVVVRWRPDDGECRVTTSSTALVKMTGRGAPPTGMYLGWRFAHIDVGVRQVVGYGATCPAP